MFQRRTYRQIYGFFIVSLKSQFRSPSTVFFGLLLPLILILIFGLISDIKQTKLKIGYVNYPQASNVSFRKTLDETGVFEIRTGVYSDLIRELESGRLDSVVNFNGKDNLVQIVTSTSKPQQSAQVKSVIENEFNKLTLGQLGVKPVYEIKTSQVDGSTNRYTDFVLPGLIGFTILFTSVTGISVSFLTLKKSQVIKRLFAAPTQVSGFLIGQSLSRVVFSLLQSIILIGLAMNLFQYSPRHGLVSLGQMLVVILLGLIVFIGVGYVVAGLVQKEDQANPIAQLIILPQIILAGVFFPVESLPDWLQTVAKMLPLYYFNEALRLISLDGLNLWNLEVAYPLLSLLLWMIGVYFTATKVFRVR
jgi:ABC-2 type transport system permease protein